MPTPLTASRSDPLSVARCVLLSEAAAVSTCAQRLDDRFCQAVDQLIACSGRIGVTGVGKSADVGLKLVGTFNSTGTRAYFLDATKALHGDLGMVHPDDVVVLLSHSGESDELLRLLQPLTDLAASLIAITSNSQSTLARNVNVAVVYGPLEEACPLSLAPSASTTVMLALGDALAFTLSTARGFTADDFARYHPAGSLGRKLARVESYMRSGSELRIAPETATVREVFAAAVPGRRTGAVMLVDADGKLTGLFTDSDLARVFERRQDSLLDQPISTLMTRDPITVPRSARWFEAIEVLRGRKISEIPVIDESGRPVGLLDITDAIGLLPLEANESAAPLRFHDASEAA